MNNAIEKVLEQVTDPIEKERAKLKLGELGLDKLLQSDEEEKTNTALDLYKMEYEKAVERYENIYKAVWQNFSYMSIVAGGILTFGSNFLGDYTLTAFLSCIPLLFWYVVTFVPMNRYGYKASDQLAEIEQKINAIAGTDLNHFRNFKERRKEKSDIVEKPSVRFSMLVSFIILSVVALYFFANTFLSPSYLFKLTDFHEMQNVAVSLKNKEQDNTNIYSIRQKMSDSIIKELEGYDESFPLPLNLQKRIVADFNRLIEGPDLSGACLGCTFEQVKKSNHKYLQSVFPSDIVGNVSNLNTWFWYLMPQTVFYISIIIALCIVGIEWKAIWRDATSLKSLHLLTSDFSNNTYGVRIIKIQSEKELKKLENLKFLKLPEVNSEDWMSLSSSPKVIFLEERSGEITTRLMTFEQVEKILKENSEKLKKQ